MVLAQDEACAAFCASLRVERAWRNVQPVLLASFEGVAQLLAAQAQQICSLERELRGTQVRIRSDGRRWMLRVEHWADSLTAVHEHSNWWMSRRRSGERRRAARL